VLDWPGDKLLIKSLAPRFSSWTGWNGLYSEEIASVTMLGDGKELKGENTPAGLSIETPKTKTGDCAYVFKIVRKNPFWSSRNEGQRPGLPTHCCRRTST